MELSVTASVDEIEDLLARPPDGSAPRDRVLELVEAFNDYIAEQRDAVAHGAAALPRHVARGGARWATDHEDRVREGRRREWISAHPATASTTPCPTPTGDDSKPALCLTMGGEAHVVLRDVCHLDADEASAVARWTAEAILTAAGL